MNHIDSSSFAYSSIFPSQPLIGKLNDYSGKYADLCKRLQRIERQAGKRSNGFRLRKQKIMEITPDITKIIRIMESSNYIRPLLALWNDTPTDTLAFPVPFVRELISHIDKLAVHSRRGRLGRLALFELCQLFFRFYDDLDCAEEISACLGTHLGRYQPDEKIMGLDKVRADISVIISTRGHEFLAKIALETGKQLHEIAALYNIPLQDSRMYKKALMQLYLTRLKALSPNEEAGVLHEIVSPGVYNIKLYQSFRVGHQIITRLMDKLMDAGKEPSPLWRDVILRIAGDPRMPEQSFPYSQWWTPIELLRPERRYAQTMRGWLSRADLELFLKIMAAYAKSHGDADLQRMYPERERFLRGLFKKGLIRETRLFLGRKVMRYLKAADLGGEFRGYAQINDGGETAIFYLNLGRAHLIVGSFNCAMRIMERIPRKSCLKGFPDVVANTWLRKRLEQQYYDEFRSYGGYYQIVHRQGWQETAVMNLNKLGVQLLPSDVMDSKTFYGGNG